MRNGKHYVAVRLTKEEKERFEKLQELTGLTKKGMLLHLVDGNAVGEKFQKDYLSLNSLLQRLDINMAHPWLSHNVTDERIRDRYYRLSRRFNRVNCEILDKLLLKDPYYGKDKK